MDDERDKEACYLISLEGQPYGVCDYSALNYLLEKYGPENVGYEILSARAKIPITAEWIFDIEAKYGPLIKE